jgi:hypothetical protein
MDCRLSWFSVTRASGTEEALGSQEAVRGWASSGDAKAPLVMKIRHIISAHRRNLQEIMNGIWDKG